MLVASESHVDSAAPPGDPCPATCALAVSPEVIFRSAPATVLVDYDDIDKCETLLDRTSRQPLTFDDLSFGSMDELTDWIGLFTRGKGEDGSELYRRCDGKCSPSYTWVISHSDDRWVVDAEVICGHARDRRDNRYDLSYSLRWICRPGAVNR